MYIKIHFIKKILYKDINMHVNFLYVSYKHVGIRENRIMFKKKHLEGTV